jgi:hypothetical protein
MPLLARDYSDAGTQRRQQCRERAGGRVGLAALDPRDLGLVDAERSGELLLRETALLAELAHLTSHRIVSVERIPARERLAAGLAPAASAAASAIISMVASASFEC